MMLVIVWMILVRVMMLVMVMMVIIVTMMLVKVRMKVMMVMMIDGAGIPYLRNKIWFGYTVTAFKAGRGYLK